MSVPAYDRIQTLGLALADGLRRQPSRLDRFMPIPRDVDKLANLKEALEFQERLYSSETGGELHTMDDVTAANLIRILREATERRRTLHATGKTKGQYREKIELLEAIESLCERLLEIPGYRSRREVGDAMDDGWDSGKSNDEGESDEGEAGGGGV